MIIRVIPVQMLTYGCRYFNTKKIFMKTYLKTGRKFEFVFLIIGIALFVAIVWKIGINNLATVLSEADKTLLTIAFLVSTLSLGVKIIRWNRLYNLPNMWDSSKIYCIGMAVNQIMPFGFGEISRAYIAKDRFHIPIGTTLVPIVIERMADFTFLVALLLGGIIFEFTSTSAYIIQIVTAIVFISVGYFIFLHPQFIEKMLRFCIKALKTKPKQSTFFRLVLYRIFDELSIFKKGLKQLKGKNTTIYSTILLTIISWLVYGYSLDIILLALGIHLPFLYVLIITATSEIIGTFSFIPSGLGAKDITFALLLVQFNVPMEISISGFLIARFYSYLQFGVSGVGSLFSFI